MNDEQLLSPPFCIPPELVCGPRFVTWLEGGEGENHNRSIDMDFASVFNASQVDNENCDP